MDYLEAGEIINAAAVECGLHASANPTSDPDDTFRQMVVLLTNLGRQLVKLHNWDQLIKEHTVNALVGDPGEYTLPSDFLRMVPQTTWIRAEGEPVYGAMNPQIWQFYRSSLTTLSGSTLAFRRSGSAFRVLPTPVEEDHTITFEYMSKNWVMENQSTLNFQDFINGDSNYIMFDGVLMIAGLKYRWLASRGFDSTEASGVYRSMLESAISNSITAPVFDLTRSFCEEPHLIGWGNVRDTGYGI